MQRVLVLEDEFLIAELLRDWLIEQGCESVAVAGSVAQALGLIEAGGFDAAILDWTLGSETSAPVAELLKRRGIPFAFVTGHNEDEIGQDFDGVPTLPKPFEYAALQATLARLAGS